MIHVVVGHPTAFNISVAGACEMFVTLLFRIGIRVFQDDVPGMQEAGNIAEAAECEVDDRVGRTNTALYPYFEIPIVSIIKAHK